ncbi:hypothetical protein PHMEG_00025825 [Phytophthora megakarya]|uniref:Uncharacterized protein n=1 Tax=Phytophthora megakarya TaxID=4795 RepID=A0A225VCT2_9STRA|nr:hypothetical protein PHMEG_00025825 [Phytophthora megakarya]
MAFQARWRELKKAGWASKRPTGLSDDFIYLKPGKTKKDVRGVDFFVGENELMCYLDEVDLGIGEISGSEAICSTPRHGEIGIEEAGSQSDK